MDNKIAAVLQKLRISHGYRQQEISKMLCDMGIKTANTQVSRWENGYNNPSIEQFIGLCKIYSIGDVYSVFLGGDLSAPSCGLDSRGKEKLRDYEELLLASGLYSPSLEQDNVIPISSRLAPLYDIGASAGTGQFLDSDSYEMVQVPDEVPESATFGLRVCGDSMEPALYDGEEIWVRMQSHIEDGEIGVFWLDGDAYVKEYHVRGNGVFLRSRNLAYEPIPLSSYSDVKIYGKVVYPQR